MILPLVHGTYHNRAYAKATRFREAFSDFLGFISDASSVTREVAFPALAFFRALIFSFLSRAFAAFSTVFTSRYIRAE